MTGGRLVVCPTPIGNLEDVTLRVLVGAARRRRRSPARTRAARACCSSATACRRRSSPTTSTTSASGRRSWWSGCWPARSSRWCPTPGCRWSAIPATCSCRAAWRRGSRSRCCRDRRRRWRRWWRRRCRPTCGGSPASCRASAAALVEVLGSPETVVAFESPRRVGASLAVLAELDPSRPVAVCRELTKVHEEVVRGTAAELAARYADEAPRGEVVLVIGGAPARTGVDPAAVDAVRRLVEAGARARPAATRRRRAHRGARERAVSGGGGVLTRGVPNPACRAAREGVVHKRSRRSEQT